LLLATNENIAQIDFVGEYIVIFGWNELGHVLEPHSSLEYQQKNRNSLFSNQYIRSTFFIHGSL